ncbi:uncharacterized protein LOC127718968 [Mytilus californianus]|uniref:uncharacterized protein LOC127718968 n=1 Tax=Mytilus californianus TaxID=6549 RepID=UPI0022484450|nr:uncharacterized protein LOC127718968 [Mytilus californianus]
MDHQKDIQSLSHNSCILYHYLSNKFGSKTVVTCRRYKYKCFDDCMQNADIRIISSGSKAEGLDLPGSDLDLMFLSNEIVVYENVPDDDKDSYLLDTENASVGFAFIKVPQRYSNNIKDTNTFNGFLLTNKYIKERFIYELAKDEWFMGITRKVLNIQGPSISATFQGVVDADLVQCHSCYDWPSVAKKWIFRSRFSNWPAESLIKESIIEGVLLVPVGSKSNSNVENCYEWRLSFSLVEKILIHSFNHCQLLCYALLKIVLKEIIDSVNIFNKLLCSYFIKTVLFWVPEELSVTYWIPKNLLRCFSFCIQRLQCFILCNYIPNYFIPEHNLIEGRFPEEVRKQLEVFIGKFLKGDIMKILSSSKSLSGLQRGCVLSDVSMPRQDISDFDKTFMTVSIFDTTQLAFIIKRSLNFFLYIILNEHYPKPLKNTYAIAFLDYSRSEALSINMLSGVSDSNCNDNKHYYSKYNQCLCHLLLSRYSDAVSGWLLLAVFFYSSKEYYKMIDVLQISKEFFSPDLIHLAGWWNLPTLDQIRSKKMILQSKSFLKRLRTSFSKSVTISKNNENDNGFVFHKDLTVTSEEFCIGSPIVYHRYLTFLYAYKVDSTREITIALQSLKEAIENSINSDVVSVLTNYMCLFKAQQRVGIQENYSTYLRMLPILSSSDTKHILSTLNTMF